MNQKRPMEGWYLRDALKRLAEIFALAGNLKHDLSPLAAEDKEAGAEPLSQDQINETLDRIQLLANQLAVEELQATSEEWYAAIDKMQ